MQTEILAAAILAAGFAAAHREPLTSGYLDESIREKFVEYLAFVREQTSKPKRKTRAAPR